MKNCPPGKRIWTSAPIAVKRSAALRRDQEKHLADQTPLGQRFRRQDAFGCVHSTSRRLAKCPSADRGAPNDFDGGRRMLPLGHLPDTRYPDPRIEALDKRFIHKVGNAGIERIATGFRWAEGPVYFRDGGYFVWSDIPNNRMLRWLEDDGHVSVFRSPSNHANGNTRDREGRLVTCEHGARRVTRTELDGTITVLMDNVGGKPLNAPNDVVVASDGSIWFTDPGYGILTNYEGTQSEFEIPVCVYRIDPVSGAGPVVADDFVRPNGLAFSPDEKKLYIVDSGITHGGPAHIRAFDVDGGTLRNGTVFAEDFAPGLTDGIRVDVEGNVWGRVWRGAIRRKTACASIHQAAI